MPRRLLIVFVVAIVAGAAPARAWCEATCVAPATHQQHCPAPEPSGGTATMSSNSADDCPVLESARPPISARLDVQAVAVDSFTPALDPPLPLTRSAVRPPSATTVFERCTPLRI